MADFCRQCTWGTFRVDDSDFNNIGNDKPPLEEGYGYPVICEGCGITRVDDNGLCIDKDCLKNGHPRYAKSKPKTGADPAPRPDEKPAH